MTREEIVKALKPIADGLFGKQRRPSYEKPHYEIRGLNDMLQDLTAVAPDNWWPYAFSRDPINGKLTDGQRVQLMHKSVQCGYEYADKIAEEYGTDDPVQIAKKMGMVVTYPEFPERTDRVLFAEFKPANQIRIYMDAVYKAKNLLRDRKTAEILTDKLNVSKLLLSHELFHYIEEKYKDTIFTRTEKIRLWELGPFHNDSVLMADSEAAAMAFAQRLNHLPYFPYVLDVFMVYGYSMEEASGLYEEMMTLLEQGRVKGDNT